MTGQLVHIYLVCAPRWYDDHAACRLGKYERANSGVAVQLCEIVSGKEGFLLVNVAAKFAPSARLIRFQPSC